MATSQNGYSANDRSQIKTYNVPGTKAQLPLREGATGELLVELAAWIHKHVESIDAGHPMDDWGYAERPIRGSSTTLSNHASGTAFDFNATQHPLGVTGTWTRKQKRQINRFLRKRMGNVIRWGENYRSRKDGMHFEINEDYDQVIAVLREYRNKRKVKRMPTIWLSNVQAQFKQGGTIPIHGVRVIQRELNARGAELAVDGLAGPTTREAYREFERRDVPGGKADGIPGWLSIRVLAGILPGKRNFKVKR